MEKIKSNIKTAIIYNITIFFATLFTPFVVFFVIQPLSYRIKITPDLPEEAWLVIAIIISGVINFGIFHLLIAKKPVQINLLLSPIYIRFAYQILLWSAAFLVCSVLHRGYEYGASILFFSGNLFAALVYDFKTALLLIIGYELLFIIGYAFVLIKRVKKFGIDGKGFSFKLALIPVLLSSVFIGTAFIVNKLEYANIITDLSHEEQNQYLFGHGFQYERGWSSISLKPYYVENNENVLAKLDEPSDFVITEREKMPVLDGAEAAYPIYSAFANACYKDIAEIQEQAKADDEENNEKHGMPVCFTNTVEGYKSLISGDTDIFFGAKPSAAQRKMAEEAGKELILTPIGKEAFVFFVSEDNPVDELTSQQIKDIYSGKITNWVSVGGGLSEILAFQRPENSGSQTMMQYFMGDTPLKEPLEVEFEAAMMGVIKEVANYRNGAASIGYSFRYYSSITNVGNIKLLAVDGVYPDANSISNGAYPITTELYAITLKDNKNEFIEPFLEWMKGEQGQKLIADTGYVAYY